MDLGVYESVPPPNQDFVAAPLHKSNAYLRRGHWRWRIQPPVLGGGGNLTRDPNLGYLQN